MKIKKLNITVRKQKTHRYTIRFFTVLFALVPLIILLGSQQALLAAVGGLPFLLFLPVTVYYETWQLRLTQNTIERSIFGKTKSYSYPQLQQAVKSYATSKSALVISMRFQDGITWQFRIDDENGEKAESQLQKHCSIITLP
jgi:hypothetical protein